MDRRADDSTKISALLEERGSVYGHALPNLACTMEVWEVMEKYWKEYDQGPREEYEEMTRASLKAAIFMVAFKMTRIVTGRKDHWDNYDDLLGYLKLAQDRAMELTPIGITTSTEGAVVPEFPHPKFTGPR